MHKRFNYTDRLGYFKVHKGERLCTTEELVRPCKICRSLGDVVHHWIWRCPRLAVLKLISLVQIVTHPHLPKCVPAAHWWLSGNVKLGLIWGSVVHCDVFVLVCCAFCMLGNVHLMFLEVSDTHLVKVQGGGTFFGDGSVD